MSPIIANLDVFLLVDDGIYVAKPKVNHKQLQMPSELKDIASQNRRFYFQDQKYGIPFSWPNYVDEKGTILCKAH
jgi:hypothetical protein